MRSDDMEADDASQSRLAPHGGKVPWASSTAEDTVSGYSEVGGGRYEGTRRHFGRGFASSSCLEAVPLVPAF
jgi:hypothetical protein